MTKEQHEAEIKKLKDLLNEPEWEEIFAIIDWSDDEINQKFRLDPFNLRCQLRRLQFYFSTLGYIADNIEKFYFIDIEKISHWIGQLNHSFTYAKTLIKPVAINQYPNNLVQLVAGLNGIDSNMGLGVSMVVHFITNINEGEDVVSELMKVNLSLNDILPRKDIIINLSEINSKKEEILNIANQIEESKTKAQAQEALLIDLGSKYDTLYQNVIKHENTITENVNSSKEARTEYENLEKEITVLKEKTDKIFEERNAISVLEAFNSRKTEKEKEASKYFLYLVTLVGLTIAISFFLYCYYFIHKELQPNTIQDLISIVLKLLFLSPLIYLIFFMNRRYNSAKKLAEIYTFKATIGRSVDLFNENLKKFDISERDKHSKSFEFFLKTYNEILTPPEEIFKQKDDSQSLKEKLDDTYDIVKKFSDLFGSSKK